MNLIDTLLGRRKTAHGELLEIARREAMGKAKKDDADKLAGLLEATDDSRLAAYRKAVDIVARHRDMRAIADALDAHAADHGKATRALADHDAETKRIAEQRKTERGELENAVLAANAAMARAERAADTAGAMEQEHAEILGIDPPDPDLFELLGAGEVLSFDGAPTLHVGSEILTREKYRRGQITHAAYRVLLNEHQRTVNDAMARGGFNVHGQRVPDGEIPPRPAMPTWGEVVARGWHKELADAAPAPLYAPTIGPRSIPLVA